MEDKRLAFRVEIQPLGKRVHIHEGDSLLEATQRAGAGILSICGGQGNCGSCRVKVTAGKVSAPSEIERDVLSSQEIEKGYRLACQVYPKSSIKLFIPSESLSKPQRLQLEGEDIDMRFDPVAHAIDLELDPPQSGDLRADTSRVKQALSNNGISSPSIAAPILKTLSVNIRNFDWKGRFIMNENEVINVLAPHTPYYGIAADIGTTKLALYLLDLETGKTIDKLGAMNPQIDYGEDVLSRISYTIQNQKGREKLQNTLISKINQMINAVAEENQISKSQIVDGVFVGNTAMHHLFVGLPVQQLAVAPYVPAVSEELDIPSSDLGLEIASGTYIHLLPIIAGYVGADHAGVLLATELFDSAKTTMVIDIGTNTEISLSSNGHIRSCSCASGPAFEGAHIKDGMRAAPGAIERLCIVEGEIQTHTIENGVPVGMCGSGILDAVAEMKSWGIIDEKGAFQEHPRLRKTSGRKEFILVPGSETGHGQDITISRKDINEIQLAKGAIRAGQEALLAEAGIDAESIENVIIAGAFGTYLDIQNGIRIGMFPDIPLKRFHQVGNAAGMGAKVALLSQSHRKQLQKQVKKIEYLELTTYEGFQKIFMKAMYFPK